VSWGECRENGESVVKKVLAALAVSLALTGTAFAQAKIQVGCTATSDCASAMVAIDEGIFKKHGLEVEMTPIGINSNIPAAILSNSIQIGGPTSTVFLQAVDGGLDLVAIAGATVMNPVSKRQHHRLCPQRHHHQGAEGLCRQESRRARAERLPARAVREMAGGERRRSQERQFRRGHLPDHGRYHQVGRRRRRADGRAVRDAHDQCRPGLGRRALCRRTGAHRSHHLLCGVARMGGKERAAIKKFRDALAESAEIVNNDREKASNSIAKFTKQPIELVKATPPNRSEPVLKPEQLAWWIEVMSTQKMLQSKLDTSKLVLK
jgi:NitT/TauT family transport system substrate-binding protein